MGKIWIFACKRGNDKMGFTVTSYLTKISWLILFAYAFVAIVDQLDSDNCKKKMKVYFHFSDFIGELDKLNQSVRTETSKIEIQLGPVSTYVPIYHWT